MKAIDTELINAMTEVQGSRASHSGRVPEAAIEAVQWQTQLSRLTRSQEVIWSRGSLWTAILISVVFLFFASARPADVIKIRLPAIFSDNMVLQRNKPIQIRGVATPGITVTVTLKEQVAQTRAGIDGKWVAIFPPLKAGGPFDLTVDAADHVTVRNVLAGDVWLCSGQSNMARELAFCKYDPDEVKNAHIPSIRIFSVPESKADSPKFYGKGKWNETTPETVLNFAACEFFFARELQAKTGVPIGIISCCAGGQPLNVWLSKPGARDKNEGPFITSSVYNAMVSPLLGYAVKGMIWYQGESDIFRPAHYRKALPKMLTDLRKQWNAVSMPIILVQLPNYAEHDKEPAESLWAELRESQAQVSKELYDMHIVCTYDSVPEIPAPLHPPDKKLIAHRLAEAAINISKTAGSIEKENSYYLSFSVKDKSVMVNFDRNSEPLDTSKKEILGFSLAGRDDKFHWAEAEVQPDGYTVRVSCPEVERPISVRYAWADNPVANLRTASGKPVVPFRTDEFKAPASAYHMRGRFNFLNDMGLPKKSLPH